MTAPAPAKKPRKVWPYMVVIAVLAALAYIFSPFTKEGETTENQLKTKPAWNPHPIGDQP